MQDSFEIASSSGYYRIEIAQGQANLARVSSGDRVTVIDSHVQQLLNFPQSKILEITADESAKSLEVMGSYVRAFRQLGASRSTEVLAIGGGTVQDISTFLCSIYMRGLKWSYMPTTLLAMVDSCIGGKSAINAGGFKNLVGNFYPPQKVVVDLELLGTMSSDMLIEGLVEAAKICFARGADCFDTYSSMKMSPSSHRAEFAEIIALSLKAKKWFVEIDEFDKNERLLLNFGHTFGHAIEAASEFRISHGIAVGIGILIACRLSKRLNNEAEHDARTEGLCRHIRGLLAELDKLNSDLPMLPSADIVFGHFEADKKHDSNSFRVVIPNGAGGLQISEFERCEFSANLIKNAMSETIDELLI